MHKSPTLRVVLSLSLAFAVGFSPVVMQRGSAAPQGRDSGQGDQHRDDPCSHLPDPPGLAKGIDKQCPAGGSSSGVAKGDFNGDGFADLAIGEPGASIGGHSSAGDVIVLYGSGNGLTASGKQLWYEGHGAPGRSRLATFSAPRWLRAISIATVTLISRSGFPERMVRMERW